MSTQACITRVPSGSEQQAGCGSGRTRPRAAPRCVPVRVLARYARPCLRRLARCIPETLIAFALLSPAVASHDTPERPVGPQGGPEAIRPTATSHAELEGTIRSIDPLAKAIRVSGEQSAGRDMVLQVIDHTKIQVEGRPSLFTDLRQGDVIGASYENRYGIKVTGSIDVRSRGR